MKKIYLLLFPIFIFTQCISNKDISALDKNKERYYPLGDHGKWGFSNEDGETIIACKFNSVDFFYKGLAIAKLDGKYGYINKKGKWHIKPKYESATRFYRDYTSIKKNGKYKTINRKGKKVKKEIYPFSVGCLVNHPVDLNKHAVKKEGKHELVFKYYIRYDSLNQEVFTDTSNIKIDSLIAYSKHKILVKKNKKYGFYNLLPRQTIIIEYDENKNPHQEAKSKFKAQIDFIYDDVQYKRFGDNEIFSAKVRIGNKWGIINGSGQTMADIKYLSIKLEQGINALVEYEKNKFGYIKFGGKEYFKRTLSY